MGPARRADNCARNRRAGVSRRAAAAVLPQPPAKALQIASPPSGATYLIDPTLRREFQALPLRATTDRPGEITWSVDGHVLGRVSSEQALAWPLVPGTHRFVARDARGHSSQATVTVR